MSKEILNFQEVELLYCLCLWENRSRFWQLVEVVLPHGAAQRLNTGTQMARNPAPSLLQLFWVWVGLQHGANNWHYSRVDSAHSQQWPERAVTGWQKRCRISSLCLVNYSPFSLKGCPQSTQFHFPACAEDTGGSLQSHIVSSGANFIQKWLEKIVMNLIPKYIHKTSLSPDFCL